MNRFERAYWNGFTKEAGLYDKVKGYVDNAAATTQNAVNTQIKPRLNNIPGYTNMDNQISSNLDRGTGALNSIKTNTPAIQNNIPIVGTVQRALNESGVNVNEEVADAWKHKNDWTNLYNKARQIPSDAWGTVAPKTIGSYNNAKNTWNNFSIPGVVASGMAKGNNEFQDLENAVNKYNNYEQVPLWRRALGLHQSRPNLTTNENSAMKDALNTPGVSQYMWDQTKSQPLQTAKAIANPSSLGSIIRGVGYGTRALSKLPYLSNLEPIAEGAGTLGGGLSGAGLVLSAANETPDLARNMGESYYSGNGALNGAEKYMESGMDLANKVHSPASYLQNVSDGVFHPMRTLGAYQIGVNDIQKQLLNILRQKYDIGQRNYQYNNRLNNIRNPVNAYSIENSVPAQVSSP